MKRGNFMIQHFSYKPLYANTQLPGWNISFFYQQCRYEADYLKDGSIVWHGETPQDEDTVKKMIHELMLFHVYD